MARNPRIFLISPAFLGGQRAARLLRGEATFPLAERLYAGQRVGLGEVYAFVSGLYFRGKLTYADTFAAPPPGLMGVHVITPSRGLVPPEAAVTLAELRADAGVDLASGDPRFVAALSRDADALAARLTGRCPVVLLGSIATGKYTELLLRSFGERLCFPREFVGRGDMSRGGLLLRAARAGQELAYVPVAGAVRHGPRAKRIAELRP